MYAGQRNCYCDRHDAFLKKKITSSGARYYDGYIGEDE